MDRIYTTDLPRVLRKHGVECSYYQGWKLCVEGRIPAERDGKRWYISTDDLPAAIAAFTPAEQ